MTRLILLEKSWVNVAHIESLEFRGNTVKVGLTSGREMTVRFGEPAKAQLYFDLVYGEGNWEVAE